MAKRVWLRAAASLVAAAYLAGPASAQNYDGDVILRFGAFAQGSFLNFGVKQPFVASAGANGLAGGLSAGIDYAPHRSYILGFEFDASMGDARNSTNGLDLGLDYLATLRGRFGVYPDEKWLLYGTAGVAFLGFEAHSTTGSKAAETVTGLTVGFGAEYNWHNVILFGEYDYTTFGERKFVVDATQITTDADAHMLRFGVKFKVGHDHHDVGRYYEPMK